MTDLAPRDVQVPLADGRTIACTEVGDPDGRPIISCHGGLSSRLDIVPSAEAATRLGVRVISPDRPGIGGSTRQPGRTLLDWPGDVAAVADHLGIDRFAVMGWSLGGIYAAACAHALSDRVTVAGLVASSIPADWPGMHEELNRMDRVMLDLSGKAAPLDRTIFSLMRSAAHHAPKAFAKSSGVDATMGAGDLAESLPAAVAEGLADTKGVVDDYRVFGAPWGFRPEDIGVEVHLWQGDADELVPPAWAERLAEAIPGSTLHPVAGASHFLWYDHWDEIFTTLAPASSD